MEKVSRLINVRFEHMDGRLRFEVANDIMEQIRFDRTCHKINNITNVKDWRGFIDAVTDLFKQAGFDRIAM